MKHPTLAFAFPRLDSAVQLGISAPPSYGMLYFG